MQPALRSASSVLLLHVTSPGRKQAASIISAKEAVQAQAVDGEGQERGLGRGQAAARSQETADGGKARGVSTAELRHGKRRQHRNLRPRGPDPPLRMNQHRSTRNNPDSLQTFMDTNTQTDLTQTTPCTTDAQKPIPHSSTAEDRRHAGMTRHRNNPE